jgi:O-antigen ligase
MAILEETGVLGFALYLGFVLCTLVFLLKEWRTPGFGFLGALSTGFFLAGVLHSMFEAWFLATGPESAFFWAGLGLAVGALDQVTVRTDVSEYRARAILQYSR